MNETKILSLKDAKRRKRLRPPKPPPEQQAVHAPQAQPVPQAPPSPSRKGWVIARRVSFASIKGTLLLAWMLYAMVWSIGRYIFMFLTGVQFLKALIGLMAGHGSEVWEGFFIWSIVFFLLEMVRYFPVLMGWIDIGEKSK
jgi:hypothetical protein